MRVTSFRRALAWNGPLGKLLALTLAVLIGIALLRLTPLMGLVIVGSIAIGVGTLFEPFVGLSVALFLGPLKAYLSAEVPQVPAQIAHVFIALALAAWLVRGLARRNVHIPRSPLLVPLLLFLGTALLSLWDAIGLLTYGVPELIKWGQILLLFVFVSDQLTPRRLPWLMAVLLAIGLFQAGFGIWQFALRGEGPGHFAILGGDFYRAYGTFEQPNPYAGFLAMILSLTTGVTASVLGALGRERGGGREGEVVFRPVYLPFLLSIIVIMGAALSMSWSRGAWLGFGAAASAMTLALPRKAYGGTLLIALLVVAGIGLNALGLLPAFFTARLTSFVPDVHLGDMRGVPINDANYAVVERLAHWQAALSMFRYHLWTGVGLGCYEPAYRDFALINWPIALGHAHNYYLNLAAETGLLGLLAYLALWGVVFWQIWRVTRRARGPLRGIAVGLLGTWTHLSIHHVLDNLYVNNVHLYIGVLLGLTDFVVQRTKQSTLPFYDRQA